MSDGDDYRGAHHGRGDGRAFVLAECNLERDGDVLYLPIYMVGMLANE